MSTPPSSDPAEFYRQQHQRTSSHHATTWQIVVQALYDVLAFLASGALANVLADWLDGSQAEQAFWQGARGTVFLALLLGWLFWFGVVKQAYTRRKPFWTDLQRSLTAILIFAVLDLALLGLLKVSYSRFWWLAFWGCLLVLQPWGRGLARRMLMRLGKWNRHTVIYGVGPNAWQACLALRSEPALGVILDGFVAPPELLTEVDPAIRASGLPVVEWQGTEDQASSIHECNNVIAFEAEQRDYRDACIRQLTQYMVRSVRVIPSMRGVPLYGMETSYFFSHEVLQIHLQNNLAKIQWQILKRSLDIFLASIGLFVLSPFFLWIAFLIKREDGGPVIYHQARIGKDGKAFKFYKFRSMVVNAGQILEQWKLNKSPEWLEYKENNFKLANDPRILKIGRFIRRTSVDEFPQLFNVLKGDMSLIGPRPLMPSEVVDYGEDISLYGVVRPGMSGLWQVSGRSNTSFADRIYFDGWYIKNWSPWMDVVIIAKTFKVVLAGSGAY
ncbi:undecaprenyl-phosphate galactose phosphotransferase WbaP [Brachymonas sp.]|uniref:undecaprenyl-phosphate galactose phosphotransferase WbaP n=1 Tax=Brachymonas sp. TaxID=1936292 RepID=UPI0035B2A114